MIQNIITGSGLDFFTNISVCISMVLGWKYLTTDQFDKGIQTAVW